jgi:CHAD domain-containing protein
LPFSFQRDEMSSETAVRRIAAERLETSRMLFDDTALSREVLIHELRKNVKKSRALLRLVRPNFKGFARENAALRDAARIISDLRDADVLGANFDRVAAQSDLTPDRIAALRSQLVPLPSSDPGPEDRLNAHRDAIAAIESRISGWKVAEDDFDTLSDGLEQSWHAARTAMHKAMAEPTGAALHTWRKRVKDHWYHARLLAPIWPEMMQAHITVVDTLGETLGDARDLAFLVEALTGGPFEDTEAAAILARIASDEERKLLKQGSRLGALLLSEPASGLARRWRGWWQLWRGASVR